MSSQDGLHGKQLALRMAPFVAVSAACVVYGVLADFAFSAVVGVLAIGGFAVMLWRNWKP